MLCKTTRTFFQPVDSTCHKNVKCVNYYVLFSRIGIKLTCKDSDLLQGMKTFSEALLYAAMPNFNECRFLACPEIDVNSDWEGSYSELVSKLNDLKLRLNTKINQKDFYYSFAWTIDEAFAKSGPRTPSITNLRGWGSTQELSAVRLAFSNGSAAKESPVLGL